MTRVTIRVPALRGLFAIEGHPSNANLYIAYGKSYNPFEIEAETLGSAVDTFLKNINRLRKTPEAEALSKIRSEKIKKTKADNAKALAGNIGIKTDTDQKPKEGEKGKRQTA